VKLIRRWIFRLWYRYIYVPIFEAIYNYKHRNDPAPPPPVCQICGKPGHREWMCPNAKSLGF